MALWVIELNDIAIRVTRDGEVVDVSPGVAVVNRKQILTGVEAAAQQHLNPREVYNRYWQHLNEAPLAGATRQCRHHADLAYHHLHAIIARSGQPSEVIFAVPAHYREQELGLLLGICRALKLDVAGFVDSNVAALASAAPAGAYVVAEIYQHHATLVEIEVHADNGVSRGHVEVVEQSGLARIHAACINLLADAFLEQSRFDPLHEAATEQLLYTNIATWLAQSGAGPELDVAIDYHGTRFSARISHREFERVTNMVLAPIAERLQGTNSVLLSPALAALPGSSSLFASAQVLAADACTQGVAEHRLAIHAEGQAVPFVTELPAAKSPNLNAPSAHQSPAHERRSATHILSGSHAFALGPQALYLDAEGELTETDGDSANAVIALEDGRAMLRAIQAVVTVNGVVIKDSCVIQPGDRIAIGAAGAAYMAISVSTSSAA